MLRTTVMLPEETHSRLRRLARRRGVPLAALIREALTRAAESEDHPELTFIGAVSVEGTEDLAVSTTRAAPPLTPPMSRPSPEELERLRRRADELARKVVTDC